MAYVITEICAESKCLDCLEVCPVDAIHPTPGEPAFVAADQLFINANACISCGSCARVCPLKAAVADEKLPSRWIRFDAVNAAFHQGA